jgi:hypothetical protein
VSRTPEETRVPPSQRENSACERQVPQLVLRLFADGDWRIRVGTANAAPARDDGLLLPHQA